MHWFLMLISHFFTGKSVVVVVLDRFFFIWKTTQTIAGRVMVVLSRNNCMGICCSTLRIDRLMEVVVSTGLTVFLSNAVNF